MPDYIKMLQRAAQTFGLAAVIVSVPVHSQHDHHGHGGHDGHDEHEDAAIGPHGGRLLTQGETTLELAIIENGVPPQFRAWIRHEGNVVENAQLQVELTRLGGRTQTFEFERHGGYWQAPGVVHEPHSFDAQATLVVNDHRVQWDWESHEGRTRIEEKMAAKLGIKTAVAGPGEIEQTVTSYGRIAVPAGQSAQVRARFPGVVRQVKAQLGDQVEAGQILATVEANESLNQYDLRAPIAGVVTARHVSAGESVSEQPLFVITDLSPLWAELKIFPAQQPRVAQGQKTVVESQSLRQQSKVGPILPTEGEHPFVIARAELANENGRWTPGMMVEADITVAQAQVPLVVDNRALQPFNDWTVVFIKVGRDYEIRPLKLGRSDGQRTEVLDGLNAGDRYVVENSYLVKADIEKSGAAHAH